MSHNFKKDNFCAEFCFNSCTKKSCKKPHKYDLSEMLASSDAQKYEFGHQLCDYLLSQKKYSKESDLYSYDGQFLTKLGLSSNNDDYIKLAEKQCLEGIKLNDSNINGYIAYAQLLQCNKIEDFVKAEEFYKKALSIDSKNNNLLFYYGEFLHECLDKNDCAIEMFNEMDSSILNSSSTMLLSKALALFKSNRFYQFLDVISDVKKLGNIPYTDGIDKLIAFSEKAIKNCDEFGSLMDTSDKDLCVDAWYGNDESKIDVLLAFMNKFDVKMDVLINYLNEKENEVNGKKKVGKDVKARFESKKNECINFCHEIQLLSNSLGLVSSGGAAAAAAGGEEEEEEDEDIGSKSKSKTKTKTKSKGKQKTSRSSKGNKAGGASPKEQLEHLLPEKENVQDIIEQVKETAMGSGNGDNKSKSKKSSKENQSIKDMSKFESIHDTWMKETAKIVELSNQQNANLDLTKYHETMQLIENQRNILHKEWQKLMQQFTNQSVDTTRQLQSTNGVIAEESKKAAVLSQKLESMDTEFSKLKNGILANFDASFALIKEIQKEKKELESVHDNLSNAKQEFNKLTIFSNNYKTLLAKYKQFGATTEEHIPKLLQRLDIAWKESEKQWFNWDIITIVGWFEYVLNSINLSNVASNNSNNNVNIQEINFDDIRKNLEKVLFRGKYLATIDVSDLHNWGFKNALVSNILYQRVVRMCQQYPKPAQPLPAQISQQLQGNNNGNNKSNDDNSKGGGSGSGNVNRIDERYLCPITRRIMRDPVIAYDNHTYERDTIIGYWRRFGKSPMNNMNVPDVAQAIGLLYENVKLRDEIKSKQFSQEEMSMQVARRQAQSGQAQFGQAQGGQGQGGEHEQKGKEQSKEGEGAAKQGSPRGKGRRNDNEEHGTPKRASGSRSAAAASPRASPRTPQHQTQERQIDEAPPSKRRKLNSTKSKPSRQ